MAADSLHTHGPWTSDRIAGVFIAAALPPFAAALYEQGATAIAPGFAVALFVTLGWQLIFAWSRHSPIGWDGVVTAIAFIVVMLPAAAPLWQIALAVTFGVVVGEQIFGGRGRAFLNPAAVALAFLFFSFPASSAGAAGNPIALATLPGAVLLIVLGLVSWRIVVAAYVGLAVAGLPAGIDNPLALLTSGSFAFGLIFLGCDPVSAAATNLGRLIYGFLIGVLAATFGAAEATAVVFAVLVASIFAPMIDHAVIWLHALRRSRRRG